MKDSRIWARRLVQRNMQVTTLTTGYTELHQRLSYTCEPLQKLFSHKVQIKQKKMNSYLNIPVYSLTSLPNIKDESK